MKADNLERPRCRNYGIFYTLLYAAFLSVLLMGCGASVPEQEAEENGGEAYEFGIDGYYYAAEYETLDEAGTEDGLTPALCGSSVYYVIQEQNEQKENFFTICRQDRASGEVSDIPLLPGGYWNILTIHADREGNIYYLASDYSRRLDPASGINYTEFYLVKLDSQGKEVYRQDITSFINTEVGTAVMIRLVTDGQGRLYMDYSSPSYGLFDDKGNYCGLVKAAEGLKYGLGCGGNGKVYACTRETSVKMREVLFDSASLGEAVKNFPDITFRVRISGGLTADILTFDDKKLYEFDVDNQSLSAILKWEDSGINPSLVEAVSAMDDGRILVLLRGSSYVWETACLTRTSTDGSKEKTQLMLGTLSDSPGIERAVVDFNQQNSDYRVFVKNYGGDGNQISQEDARNALNSDFAAGKGPDILVLNNGIDIASYLNKGMLENLNPYLDKSVKIRKEDFLKPVWELYCYDGLQAGLPAAFTVQTLIGKLSVVGEREGWTAGEMMEFAASHQEALLMEGMDRYDALMCCLMLCQDEFVDPVTGGCSFESEPFYRLLEFAAGFPAEAGKIPDRSLLAQQLEREEALVYEAQIISPESFIMALRMFGEEAVCVGYPTPDKSNGCLVSACGEVYGISSSSRNKQGAWEFIESWVAGETQEKASSFGLSACKEKLERDMRRLTDENHAAGVGLFEPASAAELEQLKKLVEGIRPLTVFDEEALKIIGEESLKYFSGQKTAEETAKVIQNRVALRMKE